MRDGGAPPGSQIASRMKGLSKTTSTGERCPIWRPHQQHGFAGGESLEVQPLQSECRLRLLQSVQRKYRHGLQSGLRSSDERRLVVQADEGAWCAVREVQRHGGLLS